MHQDAHEFLNYVLNGKGSGLGTFFLPNERPEQDKGKGQIYKTKEDDDNDTDTGNDKKAKIRRQRQGQRPRQGRRQRQRQSPRHYGKTTEHNPIYSHLSFFEDECCLFVCYQIVVCLLSNSCLITRPSSSCLVLCCVVLCCVVSSCLVLCCLVLFCLILSSRVFACCVVSSLVFVLFFDLLTSPLSSFPLFFCFFF
jgi:hypothetical protein